MLIIFEQIKVVIIKKYYFMEAIVIKILHCKIVEKILNFKLTNTEFTFFKFHNPITSTIP